MTCTNISTQLVLALETWYSTHCSRPSFRSQSLKCDELELSPEEFRERLKEYQLARDQQELMMDMGVSFAPRTQSP